MGGNGGELKGPDLAAGISLAEIPDGGMKLGHAAGEAVLLARRGDDCFAIGATCTHYGGPLAEGVFDGPCVRCPWHHARFDVRSGEAVGAPALNPVARYLVERQGDQVKVGGKLTAPPPVTVSTPATVVIVGAGAAGHACAERLRKEGHRGRIVLLSADAADPVDRPNLSKDYLAGNAPEEWIPLRGDDFFAAEQIELRRSTRVIGLEVAARRVLVENQEPIVYDALVLCTGAEAVRLAIAGAELPHVHTLRTLADSRAIIQDAATKKRAVVIGASFIGLEVAASLRTRGLEVHVVAPDQVPLSRVMGPELGAFIQKLHADKGVIFHLGKRPGGITADRVILQDGEELAADLVVTGVGVKPSIQLAAQAAISVDDGILVDGELRTSAPGVWAAGDVARWPDPRTGERIRVEHWVVAQRMGQAAALSILGRGAPFGDVPFFWSQHYDVAINYVGHARGWDHVDLVGSLEARDATLSYRKQGRILAIATVGRDAVSLRAELAFERGDVGALESLATG